MLAAGCGGKASRSANLARGPVIAAAVAGLLASLLSLVLAAGQPAAASVSSVNDATVGNEDVHVEVQNPGGTAGSYLRIVWSRSAARDDDADPFALWLQMSGGLDILVSRQEYGHSVYAGTGPTFATPPAWTASQPGGAFGVVVCRTGTWNYVHAASYSELRCTADYIPGGGNATQDNMANLLSSGGTFGTGQRIASIYDYRRTSFQLGAFTTAENSWTYSVNAIPPRWPDTFPAPPSSSEVAPAQYGCTTGYDDRAPVAGVSNGGTTVEVVSHCLLGESVQASAWTDGLTVTPVLSGPYGAEFEGEATTLTGAAATVLLQEGNLTDGFVVGLGNGRCDTAVLRFGPIASTRYGPVPAGAVQLRMRCTVGDLAFGGPGTVTPDEGSSFVMPEGNRTITPTLWYGELERWPGNLLPFPNPDGGSTRGGGALDPGWYLGGSTCGLVFAEVYPDPYKGEDGQWLDRLTAADPIVAGQAYRIFFTFGSSATWSEVTVGAPLATSVRNLDERTSADRRVVATAGGTVGALEVECVAGDGTTVVPVDPDVPATVLSPGDVVIAVESSGCFEDTGFSLTSPGTWVSGIVSGFQCGLTTTVTWAFVPDDDDLDVALSRFEALRAEPPFQWADAAVVWVADSDVTFARWSDAGPACTTILETEVCPREWDSTYSLPGWLAVAFLAGLWTMVLVAIWRFF